MGDSTHQGNVDWDHIASMIGPIPAIDKDDESDESGDESEEEDDNEYGEDAGVDDCPMVDVGQPNIIPTAPMQVDSQPPPVRCNKCKTCKGCACATSGVYL